MSETYRKAGNEIQQNIAESRKEAGGEGARSLSAGAVSQSRLLVALLVVVAAVVLGAHWPALSANAVTIDDSMYLTQNILVQNPTQTGYADYWTVQSSDSATPFNLASGNQYDVTLLGAVGQIGNTYSIYLDTYGDAGGPDKMDVKVVPEPMTIALLGLGGLFLHRRK
ncbi:MAG: PEP-CTERM sorting domain-containing protein [Planctomycetota bacterium]|jgi:hypothetical protein